MYQKKLSTQSGYIWRGGANFSFFCGNKNTDLKNWEKMSIDKRVNFNPRTNSVQKSISVTSISAKKVCAEIYSNLFWYIPVYLSIFMYISVYSNVFQYIPVYFRIFQYISVISIFHMFNFSQLIIPVSEWLNFAVIR